MKRALFIFFLVGIALLLVFFAWYFFFRSTPSALPPEDTSGPFGTGGDTDPYIPPDVGIKVPGSGNEVAPRLFKIADGPVAEGVAVLTIAVTDPSLGTTSAQTDDIEVRFVERASGNIYRYQFGTRTLERLTNMTLPGIHEAAWAKDGSRAFVRFITEEGNAERIETYALPASGGEGYLLEPDIGSVVVGTTSLLTVRPSTSGSIGTRTSLLGADATTLFSTPLSSLRMFAAGTGYAAATKGSAAVSGYGFYLQEGQFVRMLGPLRGLSLLPSPSGARYLYSSVGSGAAPTLSLLDITAPETTTLPIGTLSEKCVWSYDEKALYCGVPRTFSGTLPDDWYQGQVTTSDRIWKIDLTSRVATMVFDPNLLAEIDIDFIAPTVDRGGEVLVFTNKRDGSLWLYEL
jgi:hypothetical protein